MQKRGVVIDADDFHAVTSTYPEHPMSKIVPKVADLNDLKKQRGQVILEAVKKANEAHDATKSKLRGSTTEGKPYYKSEWYNENPTFTSINQKKAYDAV